MDQPTAADLLTQLGRLVGTWSSSPGGPVTTSPGHPAGGRLRVARLEAAPRAAVDRRAPRGARQRVDHRLRRRQQHLVPALHRRARRVPVYEMSINEREWKLWRSGQPFDQRFSVVLDDDGTTMTGSWDRVDNRAFVVDFEQTFPRVASSLDSTDHGVSREASPSWRHTSSSRSPDCSPHSRSPGPNEGGHR